MHLLGLRWADQGPELRTAQHQAATAETQTAIGHRLRWRVGTGNSRCLGHVPIRGNRTREDCIRQPIAGSRRCDRCNMFEATFASNLHHAHTKGDAELDPAIAAHIQQPNHLYLAAFGDGSLKIGTSTSSRLDRRLTEQGAWQARIVADTTNGRTVRHIEDAVTEHLGFSQSVSAKRKATGLASPRSPAALDAALADAAAQVTALIDARGDSEATVRCDAWSNPGLAQLEGQQLHAYPLRVDAGAHDLVVAAVIGSLVIAEQGPAHGVAAGSDRFVVDLAPLYGLHLDPTEDEPEPLMVQNSLF